MYAQDPPRRGKFAQAGIQPGFTGDTQSGRDGRRRSRSNAAAGILGSMATPIVAAGGTFDLGSETTVRRLGYGTMQLPGPGVWGAPKDPEEALRVLRRAVELGVTLIDTADSYGPAIAEPLIKRALRP